MSNRASFEGKVVLDVGTGSGILAFFAAQAGAKKVYAVEASTMASHAKALVKGNNMEHIIEVVQGKIEDIELPEKVDVIISEPIGFLLVHERMLEVYVKAREKFLKPDGLMMPTSGVIKLCPFSDQALYDEQVQRAQFWDAPDFYGVDLKPLAEAAKAEYLSQAVVGYVAPDILMSSDRAEYTFDFQTCSCDDLKRFDIPFDFAIDKTAIMHGLACWFECNFDGAVQRVVLNTAPDHPGTHWYQCRLLFAEPLAVNASQRVTGLLEFDANCTWKRTLTLVLLVLYSFSAAAAAAAAAAPGCHHYYYTTTD